MKKIIFLSFLGICSVSLALSTASQALSNASQAVSSGATDSFRLDRTDYFSNFDYHNEKNISTASRLEGEMIENSKKILEWAKAHPTETHPNGGMYLVYTAMLMLDRNNGYLESVLKSVDINRQAIVERYQFAQEFLDVGVRLAPDDDRIQSWRIANTLRLEKLRTGQVSESTLDTIMALVDKSPIFHLFNALTMASDVDFGDAREETLLRFAQKMAGNESPCWPPIFRTGEAKKCNTTSKTPFAFQGVTVYLGDTFLKNAIRLADKNPQESAKLRDQALSMYRRLEFFLFRRKTNKWSQKEGLEARIEFAEKTPAAELKSVGQGFLKSRSFLDVYTCHSCHQNGHSRKDLKVELLPLSKLY